MRNFHRSVPFRSKTAVKIKGALKTITNALYNALETNLALFVCE
jgi:hypothetical protein